MNSAKVNVWCAMSNKEIIGPSFFEDETVNQYNYVDMLKTYFYPIIQRKRLANKIIFQQDGSPPHFSKQVRAWLNEKFGDRWIGRGGFYLWGYIKTMILMI